MSVFNKITKRLFGIQAKMLLFLIMFVTAAASVAIYLIIGFQFITSVSDGITKRDVPVVRSVQEVLSAMVVGQSAVESALDIDDPARIDDFNAKIEVFKASALRFDMYLAALTWGSGTDAFKYSEGGEDHNAWVAAGLDNVLIVLEPDANRAQLTGEAGIYYSGFVKNATAAIEARREFFALMSAGENAKAEKVKQTSKNEMEKARQFAELTNNNMKMLVQLSNDEIEKGGQTLDTAERTTLNNLLAFSIMGMTLLGLIYIIFVRRIITRPLAKLVTLAEALGTGKFDARAELHTNDEMETLGEAFNIMAEHLSLYTGGLSQEVEARTGELNVKLGELERINKLMVDRELKMIELKKEIAELKGKQ